MSARERILFIVRSITEGCEYCRGTGVGYLEIGGAGGVKSTDGDLFGGLCLLLIFEAEVVGCGDVGALGKGVEYPTDVFGIVDVVGVVEHGGQHTELCHRFGVASILGQA